MSFAMSSFAGLERSGGGSGGSGVGLTAQTLTYDATLVTWDLASGGCATLTLTGNVGGLANPSNAENGQLVVLEIIQGGSGNYVISSWGSDYDFPIGETPVLSASAGAKDVFYGHYNNGKLCLSGSARGMS